MGPCGSHWDWRALQWVHGPGRQVLSCLDVLPGGRVLMAGWCLLTGAALWWLCRAPLLHGLCTCLTCSTSGIHCSTSTPVVLESRRLLKWPAQAPLSAVSTLRWGRRQILFRGVYKQELANPGTWKTP